MLGFSSCYLIGAILFGSCDQSEHWCCSVALGFDEGTVMIKIGREEPVASMDASGKIIDRKSVV